MSNMAYLSAIIEKDTLEALQKVKDREAAAYPNFKISLSSVVRNALREGLKVIEKEPLDP